MSEQPGRGWKVRGVAYFVLAVATALGTSSPDVIAVLLFFLAGVALFEAGFFAFHPMASRRDSISTAPTVVSSIFSGTIEF